MSAAQRYLDEAYTLARLEALEADPGAYVKLLADEVPAAATLEDLEARDVQLATALTQLDAMISRAMRIRLEHALAMDTSIATPTRTVFASTIVGYADRLPLLAQRAREVAARGGSKSPDATAALVVEAARSVLELRAAMRDGVLALVRDLAAASIPDVDRRARDREVDERHRRRWSAVRRDLEELVARPESILAAPMLARVATLPEQLDEPEPVPERTFADMIEID